MNDSQTPTRVRYGVVILATAMAILLYLDRICISFLERYIREDLDLTNKQAGLLLSGFFWAYAVGQVPAGWLSDRFGARAMLALYILAWSACTGLMGFVSLFPLLLLFRFGFGLAQAGAYPTSAGIVGKWVPFTARAFASGIIATGGRIGGFLAQVLTAYLLVAFVPDTVSSLFSEADLSNSAGFLRKLEQAKPDDRLSSAVRQAISSVDRHDSQRTRDSVVFGLNEILNRGDLYEHADLDKYQLPPEALRLADVPRPGLRTAQIQRRNRLLLEAAYPEHLRKVYRHGWRQTLWVYGLTGVLVAGLFWLVVRNRPEEHPRCNAAEVKLIEEGRLAANPHGRVEGIPWGLLLRSGNLWLSSISQFGTNFGWAFLITWLPRYLADVHHVSVLERGWLAGLPMLIGMSGMVAGGWLTDRLTRAFGLRWGRRIPMALTRFLAVAAYIACLFIDSPFTATVIFCIVAIATDLGTAAVWAFKQDIGGKHVGSVLGWGNMWGSVGAACSAIVLNWLIESAGLGWNAAFVACAVAFLVSGITALGVDATLPIEEEVGGKTLT